jgi:predicted O-linked N-acetylglucosamine transferase (SPINDLY family)
MSSNLLATRTIGAEDALAQSMSHIAAGRYADAESLLWGALDAEPKRHEALHLLGMLALQFKKFDAAARLAEEALALQPKNASYHVNRGRAQRGLGLHADAEASFREALKLDVKSADAHVLLGLSLRAQGRPDKAIAAYRCALELQPDFSEAKLNLANALREQGDADAARALYCAAAAEAPLLPEAQGALAASLYVDGRHGEALDQYRRALELKPEQPSLQFMAGSLLQDKGDTREAIESYRRAVAQNPALAGAWVNLGLALRTSGQAREAVSAYQSALDADPGHVEAHVNLAVGLAEFGAGKQSIALLERARDLRPGHAGVLTNLGASLILDARLVEAEQALRRAIELEPAAAQPRVNLGMALRGPRMQKESIELLRSAIALDADNVDAYDNLILALNYADGVSPQDIVEAARLYGSRPFARPLAASIVERQDSVAAGGRRLRIGYISPDLHKHSVAYFFEPVLANHDHAAFEIFCYHLHAAEDEVSARMRDQSDHWKNVFAVPDELLAQRIRDDGIDILVDLTGHTAHHRLQLFRHQPAPVQMTWLGFPSTLGVPAISYRITDWQVDPEGYERFNTETPLRLPASYFCYRPGPAPDVAPMPAASNGYVTFGSFNNLAKLSDATVALWARVVNAVPGARLILKSHPLAEPATCERVRRAFAAAGLAPERCELLGWTQDTASHLDLYQRVDIALDCFPYNGATTSCEALWMGVPVVTLCGDTQASRMGRSILTAAGLGNLVAEDSAAFERIARELAADLSALAGLRAGLRDRLRTSALMDEIGFTRALESLYREAFTG